MNWRLNRTETLFIVDFIVAVNSLFISSNDFPQKTLLVLHLEKVFSRFTILISDNLCVAHFSAFRTFLNAFNRFQTVVCNMTNTLKSSNVFLKRRFFIISLSRFPVPIFVVEIKVFWPESSKPILTSSDIYNTVYVSGTNRLSRLHRIFLSSETRLISYSSKKYS